MVLQQGEVREVGIEVINQLGQDFSIDAAEYKIISNDQEAESGFPTIVGHKIITLFNAAKTGEYNIIFKYHIGPEILKAKIFVEVV